MPVSARERKRARRAQRNKRRNKRDGVVVPGAACSVQEDVTEWKLQTAALIDAFHMDFERQQGPGTGAYIGVEFIVLVSGLLEEMHGAAADWEHLDLDLLFARMGRDYPVDEFARTLVITTLGPFYCFLGNIGRVSPAKHDEMRRRSLLARIHGPGWSVLPQQMRELLWREVYGDPSEHGAA